MSSTRKTVGLWAVALLLAALAAALGLRLARPRLEVAPAAGVRRDQPLRSEFSIANAGPWLAAREVRAACYIRDLRVATGGGLHNAGAAPGGWAGARLAAGERRPILCDFGTWSAQPRSAEVLILTSYAAAGLAGASAGCARFTGSWAGAWRWEAGPCPAGVEKIRALFLAGELPELELGQEFVP